MKFTTMIAMAALTAPLAAQSPVWSDDFNDGVLDPMWTPAFNPLTFWQCGEFGGTYNFIMKRDTPTDVLKMVQEAFVAAVNSAGFQDMVKKLITWAQNIKDEGEK